MRSDSAERAEEEAGGRRLRRQAYLLTGDPLRAEHLLRRVQAVTDVRSRQLGFDRIEEFSLAEMVRAFVSDPTFAGRAGPAAAQPPVSSSNGYAAVWEALKVLPPRRRAVIVLRYDEGLSEEEIASRLGSSPRSVAADADAGLLALRTRLGRGDEPSELVPAALAAAAGDWSWSTSAAPAIDGSESPSRPSAPTPVRDLGSGGLATPAPAEPAAVPARPAATQKAASVRPMGRVADEAADRGAGSPGRAGGSGRAGAVRRAALPLVAALAVVAAVGATAAVLTLPSLRGGTEQQTGAAVAGTGDPAAPSTSADPVPVTAPRGLLGWPARGRMAQNTAVLPAALAAWRSAAAAGEAPSDAATLLYAGPLDGRQVVLVQALDAGRRPRVAQLVGRSVTALTFVGAEEFGPGTAVLSLVPPEGPAGPVRVLVTPAAGTDGLLASDVSAVPLRPAPLDDDGVSDRLPSPPGTPTCSRVVVLGPAAGAEGRPVLASGIVRADRLVPMTGDVEVTSPTIVPTLTAVPESRWFTDGARLRRKLGGAAPVAVAALGPWQSATLPAVGEVRSQLYEVRRGGQRWLGSVVSIGSKVVCTGADRIESAGVHKEMTALLQRCPLPDGMMPGIVHVVAGPGVRSVQVDLAATPRPAMQTPFSGAAERPQALAMDSGFTALVAVPHEFPCGAGRLTVVGDSVAVGGTVPVYVP